MIQKITFEVWWCSACLTVWLPQRGREDRPDRCPNRRCRKRATWQGAEGRKAEVLAKVTQTHARPIKQADIDAEVEKIREDISSGFTESMRQASALTSSPEYSCPYCEDPLTKVVKRGRDFGKYGCPECNHLWTEAELARVIDHPRTQQKQRV